MKQLEPQVEQDGVRGSILLIDDEPQIRRVYKVLLTAENFRVQTASSFEEAVEYLEKDEFQLIITDLRMSGKTGIELIQEIRRKGIVSEVVVITGYPELETAREAMRYGALDYLTKPVFKEDLLRLCNYAIGHYRLKNKKAVMAMNMESAMRSLRDGVIILDVQQQVLFINEAAQQICGLSESCTGLSLVQTVQKIVPVLKGAITAFMAGDNVVASTGVTIPGGVGEGDRVVTISADALLDDGGSRLGTILIFTGTAPQVVEEKVHGYTVIPGIIGGCPPMQRVFNLVETLAGLDTTVLVTGESGTGKELIAEALHNLGNRKNQPFVAVNCAAIPDTLLESELFGHMRGSFTGAVKDHIGKLQQADRGTIFLDEIGDTSPAMQVRLLRFLEKRELQRVGEERTIRVNARVVTATNRDLAAKVRDGSFRQDLYYRLKVVEIHLPPLRERREDIPVLVDYYLASFSRKFEKRVKGVDSEVMAFFLGYGWPGNIRELVHVLERAVILTKGDTVGMGVIDLEREILEAGGALPVVPPVASHGFDAFKLNREILVQVLEKNRWNVTEASRELGISRTTIYRKMTEFGIEK